MYERMRVQCEYLLAREHERASVLLDSDAIVNADPRGLFTHTGDLGLTWRDGFPTAPFNGGAIVVASGAPASGRMKATREPIFLTASCSVTPLAWRIS